MMKGAKNWKLAHLKQFNYSLFTYLLLFIYFGWRGKPVGPYLGTNMGNFSHINIMHLQLYILKAILVGS
jgi:hypothetical protein